MRSRSQKLAEHSINSALSAIEIYNKPDFKDREQIFCVLISVAWESLLKAKLVKENSNRLNTLYVKEGKRYKKNRNNQPLTIDIYEAIRRCKLDPVVEANIRRIVEIRDAVVHFTAESPTLPYLVFTLGTATLRNYARLLKDWFQISLTKYHFYILPLAFDSPFKTLKTAELQKEPDEIRNIIAGVSYDQKNLPESSKFAFVCEIETKLISAKKITTNTDLIASIGEHSGEGVIIQRTVSPLDKYPLSATDMVAKVKTALPSTKQNEVWKAIKDLDLKNNSKYSKYSYRTARDEKAGPQKASGSIYNDDAVMLIIQHLKKERKT